jgi:hypothetical protein
MITALHYVLLLRYHLLVLHRIAVVWCAFRQGAPFECLVFVLVSYEVTCTCPYHVQALREGLGGKI